MPRPAKLWRRQGREGWWATVEGRQVCFGEDHAEALRAFHAAKSATVEQGTRCDGRVVVAVAVDRYLAEIREHLSPKSYRPYTSALKHWTRRYGRLRLEALTSEHLRGWVAHSGWNRDRRTWGDTTRHGYGRIVQIWARWCGRTYRLPYPFEGVRLPAARVRRPAPDGALEAVLDAATPEFRDFLVVCLETGCRPGEIRTLEASRIDLERSTAEVVGKTGPRLVGLSERALAVLSPLCSLNPTGPVLRNEHGNPWTEPLLFARMDQARDRAGVSGVVAYHTRHAFWGRALKAGVDSVAISRQLGHSNLRMLHRVYAHADHEIMASVAQRASAAASPPSRS